MYKIQWSMEGTQIFQTNKEIALHPKSRPKLCFWPKFWKTWIGRIMATIDPRELAVSRDTVQGQDHSDFVNSISSYPRWELSKRVGTPTSHHHHEVTIMLGLVYRRHRLIILRDGRPVVFRASIFSGSPKTFSHARALYFHRHDFVQPADLVAANFPFF